VALVVGGSIVIPHLRRAIARLDELDGLGSSTEPDDAQTPPGAAADASG
jgi:hypothetical protein